MDIRLEILHHINKKQKATEEYVANEYLYGLHDDIGTIRRALRELLAEGLIGESNVTSENSVILNQMASVGPPSKKSSERLVNGDIDSIRLYITLKGKLYLVEEKKINNELLLSEWNISIRIVLILLAIIGGISTILEIISWF